ncbi:metallophosphoesterase [Paenibacillus pasadenensis]|nr:metallophosphoesterase [Paenibacillus pasadenensis]
MGTWFYAARIEPRSLSVTNIEITSKQVSDSLDGIRIVQFSDTQLGESFTAQQLGNLAKRINSLQPDLVVFTGDLIDHYTRYGLDNRKQAQRALAGINAPLGKFAVYGNHDRGGGGSGRYERYLEAAGFKVLVNEIYPIVTADGDRLVLAGLDDYLLGEPKPESTLMQLRPDDFNLLLLHEPDPADRFSEYPIDLQLSGHSHGGQIRIPFMAPLVTTSLGETYVAGPYSLPGQYRPMTLYVNRGIGTTRMPLRLFSRPELTLIRLAGM